MWHVLNGVQYMLKQIEENEMNENVKIPNDAKRKHGSGGFGIEILLPGVAIISTDSGIGSIGRIDHATVRPGTVIPMHPHQDDEILTYIRQGKIRHLDTMGNHEEISNKRLMLMNAGHTFQHEEHIMGGRDEIMTGLQIFIRPEKSNLKPQVQFHEFEDAYSHHVWRLVAGPQDAPLIFRAQTWLHDVRLEEGASMYFPELEVSGAFRLLYVFSGSISVGEEYLKEGESLLIRDDEQYKIDARSECDIVLLTTDTNAESYKNGMFSGNLLG